MLRPQRVLRYNLGLLFIMGLCFVLCNLVFGKVMVGLYHQQDEQLILKYIIIVVFGLIPNIITFRYLTFKIEFYDKEMIVRDLFKKRTVEYSNIKKVYYRLRLGHFRTVDFNDDLSIKGYICIKDDDARDSISIDFLVLNTLRKKQEFLTYLESKNSAISFDSKTKGYLKGMENGLENTRNILKRIFVIIFFISLLFSLYQVIFYM